MKSMNIGAIAAVAAILCATPVSLRLSQGNSVSSFPLTAVSTSAEAAELSLPARHHHAARYRHRAYARLYNPYCNGPYTGGGWNGGAYYGGPWIDLLCYSKDGEIY